jgi:hypothetical protein
LSPSTIQVDGMCVAPAGGVFTSGTRLALAACGGTTAQLWQASSAPNTNRIQAKTSATACIAATGTSVGSAVSIATCSTSDSQKWAVDSIGRLLPRNAMALCLDTEGGSLAAGARLVLNTCSGSAPSQVFYPPAAGGCQQCGCSRSGCPLRLQAQLLSACLYTPQYMHFCVCMYCRNTSTADCSALLWCLLGMSALHLQHAHGPRLPTAP